VGLGHEPGLEGVRQVLVGLIQRSGSRGVGIGAVLAEEALAQKGFQDGEAAGVDVAAPAGRRHRVRTGPLEQELLEDSGTSGGVAGLYVGLHQPLERAGRIPRHRLIEVVDVAEAGQAGQGGDVCCDVEPGGGGGAGGVAGEDVVAHLGGAAVGLAVAAQLGAGVALAVINVAGGVGEVEGLDAVFVQGMQFARVAAAVAVGVLPDLQIGPEGVGRVDASVRVAVPFGQGGKAVGGKLAGLEPGLVAEEFAAGVDLAAAVAIPHQQAVVLADPAGLLGEAVGVVVEVGASAAGHGFEAVTVQVEGEGVVADNRRRLGGGVGLLEGGDQGVFGVVDGVAEAEGEVEEATADRVEEAGNAGVEAVGLAGKKITEAAAYAGGQIHRFAKHLVDLVVVGSGVLVLRQAGDAQGGGGGDADGGNGDGGSWPESGQRGGGAQIGERGGDVGGGGGEGGVGVATTQRRIMIVANHVRAVLDKIGKQQWRCQVRQRLAHDGAEGLHCVCRCQRGASDVAL